MPILRVLSPDLPGVSHVLNGAHVTVGRGPENTVQILAPSISARHAELRWLGDHYLLHDLDSTNQSQVDGVSVSDFHLHHPCRLTFGGVECEYDASLVAASSAPLSSAEMEQDVAFLRTEKVDLQEQVEALQRQIDILSTARLVTAKGEVANGSDPGVVRRLLAERDDARLQITSLKLELEKLRGEAETKGRERDQARRMHAVLLEEQGAHLELSRTGDKGTTQRIAVAVPAGQE